ncbi:glycosyltransferase family 2 protein [Hoeflea poritis]|uniref:Glycosyltransferase family 2 protein n=1 Tax=Hoeflea poritis TaxID=2993659 RepID=A0ABT4VRB8_9HYPH|nr:glycosyltransferase family 2 protein [Hoeflea poritis]MDA4846563.1 glycosyltransferase family 2 protein [Hoeflea poritis]
MKNVPAAQTGKIAVLMGVYNGSRFLHEQLQSIGNQSVEQIDLWVSDDGSTDSSLAILNARKGEWSKGEFHIVDGPQSGFSENFRSLMRNDKINADYVAFSDQDDIWDQDKLEVAIRALSRCDPDRPALYGGRTRIIDEAGRVLGHSPQFRRRPGFGNAIVQNIAGGNTMVFNRAAWAVLSESARRTSFVSHDWWCYIMISGCGGTVIYDPEPHIGYRRHGSNLVGDNISWRSQIQRIRRLVGGQLASWSDNNLASLQICYGLLEEESQAVVDEFQLLRVEKSPLRRLQRLRNSGIYRQSDKGNLGLCVAALLNRL